MKSYRVVFWVALSLATPGLVWAQEASPQEAAPAAADAPAAEPAGATDYAPQPRVTGGVLVGVGFLTMSGDVDVDIDVEPVMIDDSPAPRADQGLSVGGFIAAQLTPAWGARGEVRYSQRGARADSSGGGLGSAGSGYSFEFAVTYIEVPLLVTYTVPYDGRFTPYLFAGPDIAFLLSSEISGEGVLFDNMGDMVGAFRGTQDVKDATASVDYAVTFGAGMKFPLPAGRLVLDARYLISVTEAVGAGETEFADGVVLRPGGLRNHGLQLSAAYEF
ncbi:MAG: hypothetical protein Tsb0020_40280 [Haliangiales bacterium]